MMLSSLQQYYQRLANNPDPITGAKVPVYGFSEEKIGYVLVLSRVGELVDVVPHLTEEKKPKPKLMAVPQSFKRPGKFKIDNPKPFFLWDKSAYALGVTLPKDKTSEAVFDLSLSTFEGFKKVHLGWLKEAKQPGLIAFKRFLEAWKPEGFTESNLKPEVLDANIVFQLDGEKAYIHDSEEAKTLWKNLLKPSDSGQEAMCLITGNPASIARLHPAIKGVPGGQSSGVSIVSFNKESFNSYGKEQGDNAPISEATAFAYTTALNYLLRRENNQSISLGGTTVVFWAVAEDVAQAQKAESFFNFAFNTPAASDDSETTQLHAALEKLAKGRPMSEIAPDIESSTQFYILGLAPNAARLSIRFWLQTDFAHIRQRLSEHFQDLSLNPLPWKTAPSVWRLLLQLVPHREGSKPKIEDVPAHLAGELMRSIITGQRYPQAILAQLLARFRADGDISGLRVAMVKAILQRDFRKQLIKEEIPMSLDENNTNPAYLLGRLFALLENIQRLALGDKVNATITDKYYASASTVPYSVYPRLLSGSKHHFSKIRKDKPGLAFNLEKDLSEIMAKLPSEFPRHFSIENQGRFAIGYYQQKNTRFAQQDSNDTNQTSSEGEE